MSQSTAQHFAKPQYSKIKNASGAVDSCYRFIVQSSEVLSGSIDREESLTDDIHLQKLLRESPTWLHNFASTFLDESIQYFAKKHTVDVFLRHLTHKINEGLNGTINIEKASASTGESSQDAIFRPHEIIIYQGRFTLAWQVTYQDMRICIPVLEDEVADISKDSTDLIAVDDIEEDLKGDSMLELNDSSRQYERRRVKGARLRAKLAEYKAEHAMSRYIEKYGDEITDSEWDTSSSKSESDSE